MDDYPLVQAAPDIYMPPRSVLASLTLMGLGTPYRESLSSYYLELAHIHGLSPKVLAREIVVPRIKTGDTVLDRDNFILWKLPLFNGIGAVPEAWAKCLEDLTGQKGLIDLTLVPLRPYTSSLKLLSRTKRWCPLCFSEAAKEGRVYGQLLWEIAAVEACPKHGIRLISQCQCNGTDIGQKRNVLPLPGICATCGRSLAKDYEEFIESASECEIRRAQLIAELLGDMDRLKHRAGEASCDISTFLAVAIKHLAGGSAASFGKLLGVRKNTLHGWIHGKVVPPFPQIVEIALVCRCSIADVLLGSKIKFEEPEPAGPQSASRKPSRTKGTLPLDRNKVKNKLEMLLKESPPVSVAAAALKIGVNCRTLFRDFGDIANEISRRFSEYRHSEKTRKFEERCNSYRQSATNLARRGIMPTPRMVGLDIKGRRIILKGHERDMCRAICLNVIKEEV